MKTSDERSFAEQVRDPASLLLSLIGAEILARKGEEGPLARRQRPVYRTGQPKRNKEVHRG